MENSKHFLCKRKIMHAFFPRISPFLYNEQQLSQIMEIVGMEVMEKVKKRKFNQVREIWEIDAVCYSLFST
jgi:hypothetical protein